MKVMATKTEYTKVLRKLYCHKCGKVLSYEPVTRVVQPGDPDYREASHMGFRRHAIGAVKLTTYEPKCCACDRFISLDEQLVIERIQKKLGKHILTDEEIAENEALARQEIEKKKKVSNTIALVVTVALAVAALCLGLGLKFYL